MLERGRFAVNFLRSGQEDISRRFATSRLDKFDGVPHRITALGLPVLTEALAHVECVTVNRHVEGDHTVFIGRVEASGTTDVRPCSISVASTSVSEVRERVSVQPIPALPSPGRRRSQAGGPRGHRFSPVDPRAGVPRVRARPRALRRRQARRAHQLRDGRAVDGVPGARREGRRRDPRPVAHGVSDRRGHLLRRSDAGVRGRRRVVWPGRRGRRGQGHAAHRRRGARSTSTGSPSTSTRSASSRGASGSGTSRTAARRTAPRGTAGRSAASAVRRRSPSTRRRTSR